MIPEPNLLFVYGILKRDYPLDLRHHGCIFESEGSITEATLYRIGSGVGLRFTPGVPEKAAFGEVFRVPTERIWNWLDYIESNGFTYTRRVVNVMATRPKINTPVEAWVYEHTWPGYAYTDEILRGWYQHPGRIEDADIRV